MTPEERQKINNNIFFPHLNLPTIWEEKGQSCKKCKYCKPNRFIVFGPVNAMWFSKCSESFSLTMKAFWSCGLNLDWGKGCQVFEEGKPQWAWYHKLEIYIRRVFGIKNPQIKEK